MIDCQKLIVKKLCAADCCGCVPIPTAMWAQHKDKIQRPVEQLIEDKQEVYPMTADLKCVFLTPELRCIIYPERPEICSKFGMDNTELACPICKPNGSVRSEASKKQVMRRMDYFQKEVLKKMQRRIL